jgi:hypothetical protein
MIDISLILSLRSGTVNILTFLLNQAVRLSSWSKENKKVD